MFVRDLFGEIRDHLQIAKKKKNTRKHNSCTWR